MAAETLRPDANGDTIEWTNVTDSTHHGACSDQSDATFIDTNVLANGVPLTPIDLFQLDNMVGSGTINKVTVYIRARQTGYVPDTQMQCKTLIKTGGTRYYSSWINLTTSWADYYTEYAQNPNTSSPWTVSEINSLQGGVQGQIRGAAMFDEWCQCAEVWVVVDYTVGWTGKISGVTNPAKIMGVDVANIAKVKGVASS